MPKKKLEREDAWDLARQELENYAHTLAGMLGGSDGMTVHRLERAGVYDLLYSTFNRDMAPSARFNDAVAQGGHGYQPAKHPHWLWEGG